MTYRVVSIHDTFQGEGARTGTRAVFVRLAGCNLWSGREEDRSRGRGACSVWCDTQFLGGVSMELPALLAGMERAWSAPGRDQPPRWCVLTGGEPLLQVDAGLVFGLHGAGWRIALETNGTLPAPSGIDWITCSPKLPARGFGVEGEVPALGLEHADEVKIVLPGHPDPRCDWTDEALEVLADALGADSLVVQPCDPRAMRPKVLDGRGHLLDGRSRLLTEAFARCARFVRDHPRWRVGIQMHKVAGLP